MKRKLLALTVIATTMVASQAALAGADGDTIAYTCNGCHGTDGVSKGAAPSLKGMPADYHTKALKAFKAGSRPSTIMGRIAKGYDDKELEAVAKYYEALK
ncbi:MAG: c-type cytochrome [Gammaproteobacteria bacterium]|nr:c-type cytochrome [Gammaproteobacteria bacterium]